MSRLAHIEKTYGAALMERYENEPINLLGALSFDFDVVTPENVFENAGEIVARFAEIDPTANKSATQWMAQCYIREGFLVEDLEKVRETLTLFSHCRRHLPPEARDLGRYATLADLWKAVKPFSEDTDANPIGKELRRREKAAAYEQSVILYKGADGFTVAVPMTKEASNWWGRGTRWCTAATNDNAFDGYIKRGPLIIMVCPDGAKFQIFAPTDGGTIQFMDADDAKVARDVIQQRWAHFGPVVRWAVGRSGDLLWLPQEHQDEETCRTAVARNGLALGFVREDLMTTDLCEIAVGHISNALRYVPEDIQTAEMCLRAITLADIEIRTRGFGPIYSFMAKHLQTPEFDREAVRIDGRWLKQVRRESIDRDMCMDAVRSSCAALVLIPDALKDPDLLLEAVRSDGMAIQFIRDNEKSKAICEAAVAQNPKAWEHIPARFPDLCWAGRKAAHEQAQAEKAAAAVAPPQAPVDIWTPDDLAPLCSALEASLGMAGPTLEESENEAAPDFRL